MTDQPTTTPPTIVNVHLDNTNYATAAATAQASAVPAARKSVLVAYLALAFGWLVGVHRFYLRRSPGRWLLFMWISTLFPRGLSLLAGSSRRFSFCSSSPSSTPSSFPVGFAVTTASGRRRSLGVASPTTPSAWAAAASPGEAVAPPTARPKDLRTRLLRAAHRGDGRLTLTQPVMETEADFDEVELALHALVTAGHIDVDNDPDSGVVLYLFPELVGRPRLGDPAPDA